MADDSDDDKFIASEDEDLDGGNQQGNYMNRMDEDGLSGDVMEEESDSEEEEEDKEEGKLQEEETQIDRMAPSELPGPEHLLLDASAAREANLLQLQIDELLKEIRFDYDNMAIQHVVDKLKARLAKIPEEEVQPSTAADFLRQFNLPKQGHRPLKFKPPEAVQISGGFSSRTLALPEAVMDITVTIPAACFYHKDHLNHQYHTRRALYLATIGAALHKTTMFKQQRWEYLNADLRKPVLVLVPKVKGAVLPEGFTVHILTSVADNAISLEKLQPNRNSLRSAAKAGSSDQEGMEMLPTPLYNAGIIQDILPDVCATAVRSATAKIPFLVDAILLLKVWAKQHGLNHSPDDFGGDLLAAFCAYMAETGQLAAAMSALQIMRAVLRSLSDTGTFRKGVFMKRRLDTGHPESPSQQSFRGHFEVVFVDPSGWLNLAAHASCAALQQMQAAARRTAALLQNVVSAESAFEACFLPHHLPTAAFDYFWRVTPPPAAADNLLKADATTWRLQEQKLESLVRQALGNRITSLRAFSRKPNACAALSLPSLHSPCIILAAQVDVEAAGRAVDIGPSADSPEAVTFRQFWGEKSELRRFQDGRICEAVAWEIGPSLRHTIPDLMVRYIVGRHVPGASVEAFADTFDWALQRKGATLNEQISARRQVDASLVKLGKQLRSLNKLALKIISVQPLSASARHTSAFSPLPHPYAGGSRPGAGRVARCIDPLEILVQLEGSGKWPEEPEAFRKMKGALGVQLAEELFTGFGLRAEASEECIDVFTDGFVFRLYLTSERDEALAKRVPQFAVSFHRKQRQAVHHGLMLQLAAAHPSLRAAAQLSSRWASAHLLSNHLAQEAIELLVAAAYCPGTGLDPPGSPFAGFVRFLRTLGEHHWQEGPLLVDPDASMDVATRQAAISTFAKVKEDGFAPALPIATAADPASSHWTATQPSRQVLGRMVALARRGCAAIQEAMLSGSLAREIAAAAVFDLALADFDAVVLLRRDSLPHADLALRLPVSSHGPKTRSASEQLLAQAGFPGDGDDNAAAVQSSKGARAVLRSIPAGLVAAWGSERIIRELLVGFDPVRTFVDLLERRFGHLGIFFVDFDGGEVIAVKWHPQEFQPQQLVIEKAHTVLPLRLGKEMEERPRKKAKLNADKKRDGVSLVVPDMVRILTEIKDLGAGLIADVRLPHLPEP